MEKKEFPPMLASLWVNEKQMRSKILRNRSIGSIHDLFAILAGEFHTPAARLQDLQYFSADFSEWVEFSESSLDELVPPIKVRLALSSDQLEESTTHKPTASTSISSPLPSLPPSPPPTNLQSLITAPRISQKATKSSSFRTVYEPDAPTSPSPSPMNTSDGPSQPIFRINQENEQFLHFDKELFKTSQRGHSQPQNPQFTKQPEQNLQLQDCNLQSPEKQNIQENDYNLQSEKKNLQENDYNLQSEKKSLQEEEQQIVLKALRKTGTDSIKTGTDSLYYPKDYQPNQPLNVCLQSLVGDFFYENALQHAQRQENELSLDERCLLFLLSTESPLRSELLHSMCGTPAKETAKSRNKKADSHKGLNTLTKTSTEADPVAKHRDFIFYVDQLLAKLPKYSGPLYQSWDISLPATTYLPGTTVLWGAFARVAPAMNSSDVRWPGTLFVIKSVHGTLISQFVSCKRTERVVFPSVIELKVTDELKGPEKLKLSQQLGVDLATVRVISLCDESNSTISKWNPDSCLKGSTALPTLDNMCALIGTQFDDEKEQQTEGAGEMASENLWDIGQAPVINSLPLSLSANVKLTPPASGKNKGKKKSKNCTPRLQAAANTPTLMFRHNKGPTSNHSPNHHNYNKADTGNTPAHGGQLKGRSKETLENNLEELINAATSNQTQLSLLANDFVRNHSVKEVRHTVSRCPDRVSRLFKAFLELKNPDYISLLSFLSKSEIISTRETKTAFSESGMLAGFVIKSAQVHEHNEAVRVEALRVLRTLTFIYNSNSGASLLPSNLIGEPGLDFIADSLRSFPHSLGVQEEGFGAITNLTFYADICNGLISRNIVPLLNNALQLHKYAQEVLKGALKTLIYIYLHCTNPVELGAHFLDIILDVLALNPASEVVQRFSLAALGFIASTPENAPRVEKAGVMEKTFTAMRKFADSRPIQTSGCALMASLCKNATTTSAHEFVRRGGIEMALNILTQTADAETLQSRAAEVLYGVAKKGPPAYLGMVFANSTSALLVLNAMDNYKENETLQNAGRGLFDLVERAVTQQTVVLPLASLKRELLNTITHHQTCTNAQVVVCRLFRALLRVRMVDEAEPELVAQVPAFLKLMLMHDGSRTFVKAAAKLLHTLLEFYPEVAQSPAWQYGGATIIKLLKKHTAAPHVARALLKLMERLCRHSATCATDLLEQGAITAIQEVAESGDCEAIPHLAVDSETDSDLDYFDLDPDSKPSSSANTNSNTSENANANTSENANTNSSPNISGDNDTYRLRFVCARTLLAFEKATQSSEARTLYQNLRVSFPEKIALLPSLDLQDDSNEHKSLVSTQNSPIISPVPSNLVAPVLNSNSSSNANSLPTISNSPNFTPISNSPNFTPISNSPNFTTISNSPNFTTISNSPNFTPISNSPNFTTISNSPNFTPISNSPNFTPISNSPNFTTSNSPNFTPISNSPNFTPISNSPNFTPISNSPNFTPISNSPNFTTKSNSPNFTTISNSPNFTPISNSPNFTTTSNSPNFTTISNSPNFTTISNSPNFTPISNSSSPNEMSIVLSTPQKSSAASPAVLEPVKSTGFSTPKFKFDSENALLSLSFSPQQNDPHFPSGLLSTANRNMSLSLDFLSGPSPPNTATMTVGPAKSLLALTLDIDPELKQGGRPSELPETECAALTEMMTTDLAPHARILLVLEKLQDFPHSVEIQEVGLKLMGDFEVRNPSRAQMKEKVDLALQAMTQLGTRLIYTNGLRCLRGMFVANRNVMCDLLRTAPNGLGQLVWAMENFISVTEIQLYTSEIMMYLANSTNELKGIISESGLSAVKKIMEEHKRNIDIQHRCCALLKALPITEKILCAIIGVGGIDSAKNALVIHANAPKIVEEAVGALAALALASPKGQVAVLESEVLPVVMGIREHNHNAPVATALSKLIGNIARANIRGTTELVAMGAVERVLELMTFHPSDQTLQEAAAAAIGNIILEEPAVVATCIKHRAIHLLLEALEKFPNAKLVQKNGSLALLLLAAHTEALSIFPEETAQVLISRVFQTQKVLAVLLQTLEVLLRLAAAKPFPLSLLRGIAPSAIALLESDKSPKLQTMVTTLLNPLADQPEPMDQNKN